ncbi:hypothetical protein QR685DRAFT_567416 [Neurospora intermedia]|uniref:Uncharacterized protein n=1 Tax=Neurospora intermedia TaxID=5142 RepID=A0ABR3DP85_NEUIN
MSVILPSSSALHSCAYLLLSLSHCPISITSFNVSSFHNEFESFDGPLTVLITSKNYHGTRLSINLGTSVFTPAPN